MHINKNKHRVLDRKARENKLRAENLQKKLNTVVANVNRSRQRVTNIITETNNNNRYQNSPGGYRSPSSLGNNNQFLPVKHNQYSISRGALTTAGSSMAGVSPPSSPVNKPVTSRESKLHNLAPVPLYYSNGMLDEEGNVIKSSSGNGGRKISNYPIDKPKSPWAKRPISKERLLKINEDKLSKNNKGANAYNDGDVRHRLYQNTVSLDDFHAQPMLGGGGGNNKKKRNVFGNKNEVL